MKHLLIIFLLVLSGCSAKPYPIQYTADISPIANNEIYVVSHGWHTGFVLPADKMQLEIPELKERFKDTPYIEFGWGDKGFYQAKKITAKLTVRAIFLPTESVIHAVAVPEDVLNYFSNSEIATLTINNNEYNSLVKFISGSFYKDAEGNAVELKNGIYGNSQFYKAVGNYYLMNTCNKWTAKGLKSAGKDISPMFRLTADSIMDYISGKDQHFNLND